MLFHLSSRNMAAGNEELNFLILFNQFKLPDVTNGYLIG